MKPNRPLMHQNLDHFFVVLSVTTNQTLKAILKEILSFFLISSLLF